MRSASGRTATLPSRSLLSAALGTTRGIAAWHLLLIFLGAALPLACPLTLLTLLSESLLPASGRTATVPSRSLLSAALGTRGIAAAARHLLVILLSANSLLASPLALLTLLPLLSRSLLAAATWGLLSAGPKLFLLLSTLGPAALLTTLTTAALRVLTVIHEKSSLAMKGRIALHARLQGSFRASGRTRPLAP